MSRESDAAAALTASVAKMTTIATSVDELLTRLFAIIRDSGDVSAELEASLQALEAEQARIVTSVAVNTPAQPA